MVERPLGVTIIGILQIIGSIITLIVVAGLGITVFPAAPTYSTVIIVFAVLSLIFAIAFLTGHNWARILMLIGAILDILSIVGIIWGIILLVYLTRPNVVKYFKQKRK